MKKLFSLLVSLLVVAMALVGCSSGTSTTTTTDATAGTTTTTGDGLTWADSYEVLISEIKAESDPTTRFALMHDAEDLLMSTGAITPIYYYTDIWMVKPTVTNYYKSPLGYLFFTYALLDGQPGGDIVACIASEPDTLDPALNTTVDGASYTSATFAGLVGYIDSGDGYKLQADMAAELPTPETEADGKVSYTFTIRDGAKWSDGSDVLASDFVYAWNRAIAPETAADYAYMFDVIDGYADGTLNVTADDAAKTLKVVLPVDVPYFFELCAFPAYFPVKKDCVEANPENWASDPATVVCNGAYKLTEKTIGQSLVFEKNDQYWNAANVTMNKLTFALSDDDTAILANYQTGDYDMIDTVPNDEIEALKTQYPDEFNIAVQLGTYYVCWNVNDDAFAAFTEEQRTTIRQALGLLIDRNYVVEQIGKAGQLPANGFVPTSLSEPDGSSWGDKNGPDRDGKGYFSVDPADYQANCQEAIDMLKSVADESGAFTYTDGSNGTMFSGFPTITYLTNNGTGHVAIAEYMQSAFAAYGIDMTVDSQEWATFLNNRKDGNYSVARNGWLADYNDPISFLDMWVSASGNDDAQLGRDAHASYAGYALPQE